MDKKKRTKILGGIVAVLLLGIAVFFGGFRVTSVKVEGNTAQRWCFKDHLLQIPYWFVF